MTLADTFMNALVNIGANPCIKFSASTQKYYLSTTNLNIKSGMFLSEPCEHRDSPEDAILAYRNALKGKKIVLDMPSGERKEIIVI